MWARKLNYDKWDVAIAGFADRSDTDILREQITNAIVINHTEIISKKKIIIKTHLRASGINEL